MFNPLHFLPDPLRAWVFLLGGGFWFALFAFGTIRFLLQREWELAIFAGAIAVLTGLTVFASVRRLRELDDGERP